MLETNILLVKCPSCGAWPMAANLPKSIARRVQMLPLHSPRRGRFLRARTVKGDEPHRVA